MSDDRHGVPLPECRAAPKRPVSVDTLGAVDDFLHYLTGKMNSSPRVTRAHADCIADAAWFGYIRQETRAELEAAMREAAEAP